MWAWSAGRRVGGLAAQRSLRASALSGDGEPAEEGEVADLSCQQPDPVREVLLNPGGSHAGRLVSLLARLPDADRVRAAPSPREAQERTGTIPTRTSESPASRRAFLGYYAAPNGVVVWFVNWPRGETSRNECATTFDHPAR